MTKLVRVSSIEHIKLDVPVDVYDIGVEQNHNYFVYGPDSDKGVLVHNCHDTAADEYLKVVAQLNSLYMIGLTGTYDRKDGKIVLSQLVIGPVRAEGQADTLVPTVEFVETGATHAGHKTWPGAITWLSNNETRNALIVKHALRDVIKRDRSIVIPVDRVKHAQLLTNVLNKAYRKLTGKDRDIAAAFTGQLERNVQRPKILDDAIKGRIRIVVGIRKIVQVGLNIPRWDTIYEVIPISNPPKLMQETARIRTKVDGKQPALIKHFIEDYGPSRGCLRTCFWQTYKPERFKIDRTQLQIAMKYMNKGRRPVDDSPTIGIKW